MTPERAKPASRAR